jgi:hypothetical protein
MTVDDYARFIDGKHATAPPTGFDVAEDDLPDSLFDWQKAVVRWALRKGRSALFLDTGLGKTRQALAWADAVAKFADGPVLILTPLAVGPQFVTEADKAGIDGAELWRAGSDARIQIVNYQKLHLIDPSKYSGVVPDESSIMKSYSGKVVADMNAAFAGTPYKLCCTATPSPNDVEELGNHAAFLGVCTRAEMLATYFVHDSNDTAKWRIKGHAEEAFWKWVATWAMVVRHPSDIGFKADAGYDLPPLEIVEHLVDSPAQEGRLFAVPASTLTEQRAARKLTRSSRVDAVTEMVNADNAQWLVWCERNDEGDALEKSIRGAVQVAGKDSDDEKVDRMTGFTTGKYRVLVSKPSLCGFGMNWQHCDRMAFVGISHSFEQFYQAVRRCWRFGQTKPVTAHVVTSDLEAGILDNVRRKQAGHDAMFARMLMHTAAVNRSDIVYAKPKKSRRKKAGPSMILPAFLFTKPGK